jgi:hypothetical protein
MPIGRYRINSPTIALFFEDGRHVAHTIPTGVIINVDGLDGDKLVEVTWDGKKGLMFAQDVRSRGERID